MFFFRIIFLVNVLPTGILPVNLPISPKNPSQYHDMRFLLKIISSTSWMTLFFKIEFPKLLFWIFDWMGLVKYLILRIFGILLNLNRWLIFLSNWKYFNIAESAHYRRNFSQKVSVILGLMYLILNFRNAPNRQWSAKFLTTEQGSVFLKISDPCNWHIFHFLNEKIVSFPVN